VEHTFLFADLVEHTAFTERVGDEAAADIAIAFQTAVSHLAVDYRCEVVKNLGDAVMIHGREPAQIVALAVRLRHELADEGWCPPLRMGIHSGSAVQRDHDWYGSTVNVAARLADSAGPDEILMSLTTRDHLQMGARSPALRAPGMIGNLRLKLGGLTGHKAMLVAKAKLA
jgi:adenylate cyclase